MIFVFDCGSLALWYVQLVCVFVEVAQEVLDLYSDAERDTPGKTSKSQVSFNCVYIIKEAVFCSCWL